MRPPRFTRTTRVKTFETVDSRRIDVIHITRAQLQHARSARSRSVADWLSSTRQTRTAASRPARRNFRFPVSPNPLRSSDSRNISPARRRSSSAERNSKVLCRLSSVLRVEPAKRCVRLRLAGNIQRAADAAERPCALLASSPTRYGENNRFTVPLSPAGFKSAATASIATSASGLRQWRDDKTDRRLFISAERLSQRLLDLPNHRIIRDVNVQLHDLRIGRDAL